MIFRRGYRKISASVTEGIREGIAKKVSTKTATVFPSLPQGRG